MILECCRSNVASLLPVEIKFKMASFQELLYAILLPVALAIIKVPGHSKRDSLEAKENHLVDTSTRNAALKEINSSQNSVMVQSDISPDHNLEKLVKKAQLLASEKENQDWKFNNCWFDKR